MLLFVRGVRRRSGLEGYVILGVFVLSFFCDTRFSFSEWRLGFLGLRGRREDGCLGFVWFY